MAHDLYDRDFYLWTKAQAEALRARSGNALDYDLLAEEIEDMGKRDLRECSSRALQILIHLWKLASTQREAPKAHWRAEVRVQRRDLRSALSPSLRRLLDLELEALHVEAAEVAGDLVASEEPGVRIDASRRWTLEQILGEVDDPLG